MKYTISNSVDQSCFIRIQQLVNHNISQYIFLCSVSKVSIRPLPYYVAETVIKFGEQWKQHAHRFQPSNVYISDPKLALPSFGWFPCTNAFMMPSTM